MWDFHIDAEHVADAAPEDDTAGFTSLVRLVDRFLPLAADLERLRSNYDMVVSWYGASGSSQGGFVMPIELIQGLATLGCSLFGNVYSYDETEGD